MITGIRFFPKSQYWSGIKLPYSVWGPTPGFVDEELGVDHKKSMQNILSLEISPGFIYYRN
jgi:hypothetical protein